MKEIQWQHFWRQILVVCGASLIVGVIGITDHFTFGSLLVVAFGAIGLLVLALGWWRRRRDGF